MILDPNQYTNEAAIRERVRHRERDEGFAVWSRSGRQFYLNEHKGGYVLHPGGGRLIWFATLHAVREFLKKV